MKHKMKLMGTGVIIFLICAFYCSILTMYVRPMEDLSLDLSLLLADNASPEDFDEKGWTVFTQEGNTVTTLTPDGIGGYTGIELGQTLYFSRVLVEELDNPTLKLGIVDRNFSVFLDGELIYTDCPGLDNRIGYLKLPMREWEVLDPLTISLPANFHGKTLTIAQSTPEYSERPTVKAYPTDVMLYCGYAYESGLIAESYQTAFVAMVVFAVGLLLMLSFLRNRDAGVLSIGLAAFTWMIYLLVDTTYFYRYWGFGWSNLTSLIHPFAAGTLLFFLYTRAGKGKKKLRILLVLYTLTVLFFLAVQLLDIHTNPLDSLSMFLPNWVAFIGFAVILVLGIKYWCRENPFYRLFTPLASAATLLLWTILLLTDDQVGSQIALSLKSGQITYIYCRVLPAFLFAALVAAVTEAVRAEMDRRMEKRLIQQQYELVQASYENLRRHDEEVMILRHDMSNHFRALQSMSSEPAIQAYLNELMGQYENIRPVVQSGNKMMDIILNGKLSAAMDAGIRVEVEKAKIPEKLPLSDADLCSLVMNIMDNAVAAAAASGAAEPYIHVKVHVRSDFLALVCENSTNIRQTAPERKEKTVPKHGLGLKIIRSITERYRGMIDTEYGEGYYKVQIAIPLL